MSRLMLVGSLGLACAGCHGRRVVGPPHHEDIALACQDSCFRHYERFHDEPTFERCRLHCQSQICEVNHLLCTGAVDAGARDRGADRDAG